MVVRQGDEAAARRGRAAEHVGQDVDAAQALERRLGQGFAALGRGQVRLDELGALDGLQRLRGLR